MLLQTGPIMHISIKRMGNSAAILLSKPVLAHLGVSAGDVVDLDLIEGRVVLSAIPRHPREGWAQAAQDLATNNDDAAVWPDFDNEGDEAL
jgi:antitoxin MazE